MEKHIKIFGDYGYSSECLLHECNTVQEGMNWLSAYTRDGDGGGYEVLEVASFDEQGEYLTHAAWHADDYDDRQPTELEEWLDYDPDC